MAQMYPDYCISESPGERKLYSYLSESETTADWVVLHSLHIARHISKSKGEADFVILIPNVGVAVVEVKSHQHISVKQGTWYFGRSKARHESPFKQGETAMFSIRKFLIDSNNTFSRIPFLNVAWFTELDSPKAGQMQYQEWQVLNIEDLSNVAEALLDSMDAGTRHLSSKLGASSVNGSVFTKEHVERAVELLRPNFDFTLSEKIIRSERRKELLKFAEDQFVALDLAIDNTAAIFKGAAGTGKSVLAIELARRFSVQGRKVALLCFNRLLSIELARQLQETRVLVSTIDAYALQLSRVIDPGLPVNNLEAIKTINYHELQVPEEEKFDVIIIDEAQDVMNDVFLNLLDECVQNGLYHGKWYAFGDLDAQKIYDQTDSVRYIRENIRDVPVFTLTRNCRNVIQIGHFAEGLLPAKPKWSSFLRNEKNPDPQLVMLEPEHDMTQNLDEVIDQCKELGFAFDDIAVISPAEIADPHVIFADSKYAAKYTVGGRKPGKISFVSISKFKGLESPCVVLLDMEQLIHWKNGEDLLYVALTRATDRLVILANTDTRDFLVKLLERGA